ncbi:glucokinase [Rhizobium sp. RU20A]|uniref:ROK family protein n=1 Tax=Rhizobium sp. RU20A TaxID=1907412 RepID=UPI00095662AB|nr:ROK family protein [Rhizobium sp. RU20A]SIR28002.1 glucokinase [Rhizobium sp. RU20A]
MALTGLREAIGLDIGGTRMRVARVDQAGTIIAKKIIDGCQEPERALAMMIDLIAAFDRPEVAAIGIGIPGRVDARAARVLSGGFLDLSGIDVKGRIEARFSRPVRLENDCSMALIAEARIGAAKGLENVVMLTIGTGIGGGAMLDGRIVYGRQAAGQLGHIVVNENGPTCVCGQQGCVELYSSGTAFGRLKTAAGFPADLRCEEVIDRAGAGDGPCAALLSDWARPLRAALNTLSASFDPDILLLGGGLGDSALKALAHAPDAGRWYRTPVAAAKLGDDAGMIGSALAALEALGQGMSGSSTRPSTADCAATVSAQASTPVAAPPFAAPPFAASIGADTRIDQPASAAKRLILVNGVPASGKSSVARRVAALTGATLMALDTIKNPFLARIENVDRPFNRTLGQASYQAIFDVIAASAPGTSFVVDAWFGFQPLEDLDRYLSASGVTVLAEIWCSAPPEVIGKRYRARLTERLPGHPGESYVPELIALAARATPTGRAPLLTVDTTVPFNEERAMTWLDGVLG